MGLLELPDMAAAENDFGFVDIATLGETALIQTIETAAGKGPGQRDVTRALVSLADELGIGSRYIALVVETEDKGQRVWAAIDADQRERLRVSAGLPPPEAAQDTVVGALVEADFENMTARLRTVSNRPVDVRFDDEQADEIQTAPRSQAELIGEVTYDPETLLARSVRVRRVTRAEQLRMGIDVSDFWSWKSASELARERGIEAVRDVSQLRDTTLSEQDVDAFLEALGG